MLRMVLPNQPLAEQAKETLKSAQPIEIQVGGLDDALLNADLAITKSGTITLECALFGVPAIVFYKTSSITYFLGRQIVKVPFLAMPNLLANPGQFDDPFGSASLPPARPIFPEFVQGAATPENITRAALELLENQTRRNEVKASLQQIVASLGPPGATQRAARAVTKLLEPDIASPSFHVIPSAGLGHVLSD